MSIDFSTVKGLAISAPVTIVPQTSDDYVECIDAKWDAVIDDSTYNVVVDGVSYQCTPWQSIYGEFCLGDSRLTKIWDDEAGEEVSDMTHPEDVPFYANTYREIFGDLVNETVMDYWYFYYPDSNSHTIEIQAMNQATVTQIADASGRVIWRLKGDEPESGEPVVLNVSKITSDTYAASTKYTGETFVLLDIYPKAADSTVNVTYGGLTKTLTFSGTNAQQVYFGTFNGVSDTTETPASGEIVIEGGCSGFGCGTYQIQNVTTNKGENKYCSCITEVVDWGNVTTIPNYGFYGCNTLALSKIPNRITSIGTYAFYSCYKITLSELPSGVTSIEAYTFYGCDKITFSGLPSGITSIGAYAFYGCYNMTLSELPSGVTSIGADAFYDCNNITLSELPSGITSIGMSAFYSCDNITLSELPSGLVSLDMSAFENCGKITVSALPIGITSIGNFVFAGCTSITRFTIHENVTSIGVRAFLNAKSGSSQNQLQNVTLLSRTPPTLQQVSSNSPPYYNFGPGTNFVFTVPSGCASAYKADETWVASGYADYVVEAS